MFSYTDFCIPSRWPTEEELTAKEEDAVQPVSPFYHSYIRSRRNLKPKSSKTSNKKKKKNNNNNTNKEKNPPSTKSLKSCKSSKSSSSCRDEIKAPFQGSLLYKEDFENPKVYLEANGRRRRYLEQLYTGCPLYDDKSINEVYGDANHNFAQPNTTEIIFLQNQFWKENIPYVQSPINKGGKYAVGFLVGAHNNDDKLALSFDSEDYNFINVRVDASTMDIVCTGTGPLWSTTFDPAVEVTALNSPDGMATYDITSENTIDSQKRKFRKGPNEYTYDWQTLEFSLDVSKAKVISIVWDVVSENPAEKSYVALDNILVAASNDANSFPEESD
jgi:hypothetical protein